MANTGFEIFRMFGSVFLEGGDKVKSDLDAIDKKAAGAKPSFNKFQESAALAGAELKKLGVTCESVGKGISNVGAALSVALTAPILAGAAAGFKFNATMQDFQANFETMLNSADKAKSMIADLTAFAKSTPFEMTGLADSAKVLLNFGISANDIMPTIKMLGDVSMGNSEKLRLITLAFGQIQSTGRLMGQDLLQLINAGFNPLQVISQKTGKSMADLKKDMEKGAISADMVTDAFKIATSEGGMFFGAMDKGSKTMNGLMSTLKDTINITLGEVMLPLFKEFSENILPNVIKKIETLGAWFVGLSDSQKLNVLMWAGLLAAIGPVLLIVGKLISSIPALISGIQAIGVAFTFLAANPIVLVIAGIAAILAAAVYMSGQAEREINKLTEALIEGYKKQSEEQKAAVDKSYAAEKAAIEAKLSLAEVESNKRKALVQAEYDAAIEGGAAKEKELKKQLDDQMKALDDAYKTTIDQINDEYGVFEEKHKSKLQDLQDEYNNKTSLINEMSELSAAAATQEGDVFKETYIAIMEKAKEVHNEKIAMYEEEYLSSLGITNAELAAKIKSFQDEINGIKGKTAEEERILKEQADARKIIELQKKVDDAKDDEEYAKASENLLIEINSQAREKLIEQRNDRVDTLNQQIEDAKIKATEEKNALLIKLQEKLVAEQIEIKKDADIKIASGEKERQAKVAAEKSKYDAMKKSLTDQIAAMDTWLVDYKKKLDAGLAQDKKNEEEKLKAIKATFTAELKAMQAKIDQEKVMVEHALDDKKALVLISEYEQRIKLLEKPGRPGAFGGFSDAANQKEAAALTKEIQKLKEGLNGGWATGTDYNALAGMYKVGENGPETVYLPRGAAVKPNNDSKIIIINEGTLIGSNGMQEFADIMSRKISLKYRFSTGGAL